MRRSPPETQLSSRAAAAIIAAIAVAAVARLVDLGESGLWLDELFTARAVGRESWAGMLDELRGDVHPPAYYGLLRLWTSLVGSGEVALRLPSVVAGIAAVPLLAVLTWRLLTPWAGVISAWLLALSPYAVSLDREARSNALLSTLGLAGLVLISGGALSAGGLLVLTLVSAALLYTHPFGLLTLLGLGAWAAIEGQRTGRREVAHRLGAMAAGCVLYLPWAATTIAQSARFTASPWYAAPAPDWLGYLWMSFSLDAPGLIALLGLSWAALLASARHDGRAVGLVVVMTAALVLLPQVASYLIAPILRPRSALVLLPLLLMGAGGGLALMRPAPAAAAVTALLLALQGMITWRTVHAEPSAEGWREAAGILVAQHQPEDVVLLNHLNLWRYYLPERITLTALPVSEGALWGRERVWILQGHDLDASAADAAEALGAIEEDVLLPGARVQRVHIERWPIALTDLAVPDPVMRDDIGLRFYWSAAATGEVGVAHTPRTCAVVLRGRGSAAAGEPARLSVRLESEGSQARTAELALSADWADHIGPQATLSGAVTISVRFVNDGTAIGPDGEEDRNADVERMWLSCL